MMGDEDDARPQARFKVNQPDKNKALSVTVKNIETKEDALKKLKKNAAINKEAKDNKKEDKKDTKDTEKIARAIADEIDKKYSEKMSEMITAMKEINQTMNNTSKVELHNAMETIAKNLVGAVKDGIKDAMNVKQNNSQEDPLATQTIIQEIQKINKKLNDQPEGRTPSNYTPTKPTNQNQPQSLHLKHREQ